MTKSNNDRVGFGRPPKTHQFKPGQSGNPKGRPKGSRSLERLLEEELDRKISVTENGKRRRESKRRLAVRQQVNKAAQGDPKAFQTIARMQSASGLSGDTDIPAAPLSEIPEERYRETLQRWFGDTTGEGAQP